MFDPYEYERNWNYRERKIGCHHAEHDREIGEQQPLDWRVHDSKAYQRVVDDALSAKHKAPSKGTNQATCEERNGEQREEQCSSPWRAQETGDCRGRNSEERGNCRRHCGKAGCSEKHGRSPVLQKCGIGRKRPHGLDPVGIRIETPETQCRDKRERNKTQTDEDHERWEREEEGRSPPASSHLSGEH